jgi:hypothetical protein
VSALLGLIAHVHGVQPSAANKLMSRESSKDEDKVMLKSSDEDAIEDCVADVSGDVRLVSEFTFSSPITCVAMTPSEESGMGPSNLVCRVSHIDRCI